MAQPGDQLEDPSGNRLLFVRTCGSTGARALELEWHIPPGRRLTAIPHRHPGVGEHWKILSGSVRHRMELRKHVALAPDQWYVPVDTVHVHPANIGDEFAVARQWIDLDEPDEQLLGGVERYFETVYAFAQRGQVDGIGRIRNPLQDALTIWENLTPGSYVGYVPTFVQVPPFRALAGLARRRGLEPVHEPVRSRVAIPEPIGA